MDLLIRKAHVKQYEKKNPKTGIAFKVREHEDKRPGAKPEIRGTNPSGSVFDDFEPTAGGGIKLKGWSPGGSVFDDFTPGKAAMPNLYALNPEERFAFMTQMGAFEDPREKTYDRIRDLNKIEGVEVHRRDPKAGKWEEPKDWSKVGKTYDDLDEPEFDALNAPPAHRFKTKREGLEAAEAGDEGDADAWKPLAKEAAAGALIVEPDGRVWVVEPKNHFAGYQHTFGKGHVEPGMSPQETAIKEAMEESGLEIEILGHLGDYDGVMTSNRYYVARRIGGDPTKFSADETHAVKLVPPEHLDKFLNAERDHEIVKDFQAKYTAAMAAGGGDLKAGWATLPPWEKPAPKPEAAPKGYQADLGTSEAGGAGPRKQKGKGKFYSKEALRAYYDKYLGGGGKLSVGGGGQGATKGTKTTADVKREAEAAADRQKGIGGSPLGNETTKEKILRLLMFKGEDEDDIDYERESAEIHARSKTLEARARHKFRAARWTHKNGHPRCHVCGAEQGLDGECEGLDIVKSTQRVKGHYRTTRTGKTSRVLDYWRVAVQGKVTAAVHSLPETLALPVAHADVNPYLSTLRDASGEVLVAPDGRVYSGATHMKIASSLGILVDEALEHGYIRARVGAASVSVEINKENPATVKNAIALVRENHKVEFVMVDYYADPTAAQEFGGPMAVNDAILALRAVLPVDHKSVVEGAGAIHNGTVEHELKPGHQIVYLTEPESGSTGVVILKPGEGLTHERVAAKIGEIRERFGLKKGVDYEAFDPPARASRHPIQHLDFQGLPISIENRAGSIRSWYDPMKDETGHTRMQVRYGYVRGTEGNDGEQVDCFIGPYHDSPIAYVVRQLHPKTGAFDEHKIFLGWRDGEAARDAYLAHYDDERFFGSIHPINIEALKRQFSQ